MATKVSYPGVYVREEASGPRAVASVAVELPSPVEVVPVPIAPPGPVQAEPPAEVEDKPAPAQPAPIGPPLPPIPARL